MLFSRPVKDLTRMVTGLVMLPADQREPSDLFKPIPDCENITLAALPFDAWSQPALARLFNCLPASLTKLELFNNNMTWRSDGGVSLRHLVSLRELNLRNSHMHHDVNGLLAALPPNLESMLLAKGYSRDKDANHFTQEQVQQLVDGLPASVTKLWLRRDIGIELGSLRYRKSLHIIC